MSVPRTAVLANTTRNPYALLSAPYNLSAIYSGNEPLVSSQSLANESLLVDLSERIPSRAISIMMRATSKPKSLPKYTCSYRTYGPSSTSSTHWIMHVWVQALGLPVYGDFSPRRVPDINYYLSFQLRGIVPALKAYL